MYEMKINYSRKKSSVSQKKSVAVCYLFRNIGYKL